MSVIVSYDWFEKYCKECEFYEYERVTHKHYCYKYRILKKILPKGKRLMIDLRQKDSVKNDCNFCKLIKEKKEKNKSDTENKKLESFAQGVKSVFSDFQYPKEELTKEFIEGFLKSKMILFNRQDMSNSIFFNKSDKSGFEETS